MTLDDAMIKCYNGTPLSIDEEEQILKWLLELKTYKEKPDGYLANECELAGYNKAIDDFVNACKEDILCMTFGLHQNGIERIAEQLKKGANNERNMETHI